LMRYYSYAAQKLRFEGDIVEGIREDGYIGTFLRCGGLNANRFHHQDSDINWSLLFSYYMDLWLSQLILMVINDATKNCDKFAGCEEKICEEIFELFSRPNEDELPPKDIGNLIGVLHGLQRQLDLAINNYSFSPLGMENVKILTAPGKLVFAIPQIISKYFQPFKDIRFLYLIDELENLTEDQQKYVNTIVREKEAPCSFKIGARLYGLRSFSTYSANEVNKEGSEYELLHLDEYLRNISSATYNKFAKKLCFRRLSEAGFIVPDIKGIETDIKKIANFFEIDEKSNFLKKSTSFVELKYEGEIRPYFERLKKQLLKARQGNEKSIPLSAKNIDSIINYLACSEYPLLEKVNIYLLYQDWGKSNNLVESAKIISEECQKFTVDNSYQCRQKQRLNHFQADFFAQLLRECNLKQRYLGVSDFIDMSGGLPRNLLTILKHIYQWSVFNNEAPFVGNNKISVSSQREGVLEASDWFFRDARIVELNGTVIQDSISKLATLFRDIRFSDKPAECSISTFSADLTSISATAQKTIKASVERSLLISIPGGQRDRNTKRIDSKFQLNPMLAPRWDLPVHRRGAIALSTVEVNAIFDPEYTDSLNELLQRRIGRMTAPAFGKGKFQTSSQNDLIDQFGD